MLSFNGLFGKSANSGEYAKKAPPKKGAARFFFLAYTHFAKLVGLNMLFLLCCIPIVTIPAALSGMSRVSLLLVREGTSAVWSDFIQEVKGSFLRSLPLGLICAFFFADALFCLYLGSFATSSFMAAALMIAALALFMTVILLSCYSFALLSLVSLKNTEILRNAVSLILLKPKAALLLLICVGGGLAVTAWCLPYSVPVISVIGFSLLSLAACTIMNGPMQTCIIDQGNKSI